MKTEIKEKWVNALESGEYQQGKGQLFDGKKYCCLGVLCDLYSKETGTPWEDNGLAFRMEGVVGFLPMEVVDWADLGINNPRVMLLTGRLDSLTSLNDTWTSFKEIANLIKGQL